MVSIEVVSPTKQHLAAYSYLHVLCCIYFMSTYFRPYIYQFIHEANIFIKGKYLDALLQKYN